jgi:hypothetical protein
MSEPWDSMVRDAGYDPETFEGRRMAEMIEEQERYREYERQRDRAEARAAVEKR